MNVCVFLAITSPSVSLCFCSPLLYLYRTQLPSTRTLVLFSCSTVLMICELPGSKLQKRKVKKCVNLLMASDKQKTATEIVHL
ncbi:hypothetical protein C8R48DRAFT_703292 [Suillus tomentosus]|nr:hypothetical protein C8R48DRAFT_703292 [Suillus tomentosus]